MTNKTWTSFWIDLFLSCKISLPRNVTNSHFWMILISFDANKWDPRCFETVISCGNVSGWMSQNIDLQNIQFPVSDWRNVRGQAVLRPELFLLSCTIWHHLREILDVLIPVFCGSFQEVPISKKVLLELREPNQP